jgi:large subunit ribosomal protein L25
MSEEIVLKAAKRQELGRKVKALRSAGHTPAVIHDHGKDSIHVAVAELDLQKAYKSAGKHAPVNLDVDGKKYTTLIKEVTYAPGTSKALHTVFQAVSAHEKVSAEIPIQITGDIPAEKASLLVLKNIEYVEVEALPKDLVDSLEVDGDKLIEVGDKIYLSDIKLPAGISIKGELETPIAAVEMPKDQIAEADAALEEQKAAEGAIAEESDGAEGDEAEGSDDKPNEDSASSEQE